MTTLQLRQIKMIPGRTIEIQDVSWSEFEDILQELGEKRNTRIAYSNGVLSIMAPLPAHETSKACIGDFVKILLDELDRNYLSLGSTTFKTKQMKKAVEPDDCFYIKNFERVLGKAKLDLNVDPPPELAIEVDLTSKTQLEAYEGLGVAELWRYEAGKLRVDCLQNGQYVEVAQSSIFPAWLTNQSIEEFVRRAMSVGQGKANKEFRRWVIESIESGAS